MTNIIQRFWDKVEISDDLHNGEECWNWIGAKNSLGYGRFGVNGKNKHVHRYSYELFIGDISKGLELDHLCRNHSCCNPEHLEAVSHAENIRRGIFPKGKDNYNGKKTHCKHGHEFTDTNTYKYSNKRNCRMCIKRISEGRSHY